MDEAQPLRPEEPEPVVTRPKRPKRSKAELLASLDQAGRSVREHNPELPTRRPRGHTGAAPLPEQVPEVEPHRKEPPAARQAYYDYYALGPGRSLDKLCQVYKSRAQSAGETQVPSIRIATLEGWSTDFSWQDRVFSQMQKEADIAQAEQADVIKKQRQARIVEAQAIRGAGAQIVAAVYGAIQKGELKNWPLVGQREWDVDGKSRRVDGLLDIFPKAVQAIKIGQELERKELGMDPAALFERLIAALCADMDEAERREFQAIAHRVAGEQL